MLSSHTNNFCKIILAYSLVEFEILTNIFKKYIDVTKNHLW